jgi:hypothetical protein
VDRNVGDDQIGEHQALEHVEADVAGARDQTGGAAAHVGRGHRGLNQLDSVRSKSTPSLQPKGRTMKIDIALPPLGETAEVGEVDLIRDRFTDANQILDVGDGVELANESGVDALQLQLCEARGGELGIVACVEKGATQIRVERNEFAVGVARNKVEHLAVEERTEGAAADGAAIHVLIDLCLISPRSAY